MIEQDFPKAVSLYQEALALAEESSDDFRLDPLLNLHIHHNLAELLPIILENSEHPTLGGQLSQIPTVMNTVSYECSELDEHLPKRQRMSNDSYSGVNFVDGHLGQCEKLACFASHLSTVSVCGGKGMKNDVQSQVSTISYSVSCLRKACENIKRKYLSVFNSKLSLAQQEFKNSYMQVCVLFILRRRTILMFLQGICLLSFSYYLLILGF